MGKLKDVFTSPRVIFLAVMVVLMLIAIQPSPWSEGVVVRSVVTDSAAFDAGVLGSKASESPLSRERIIQLNDFPIKTVQDYYLFESSVTANQSVLVKTDQGNFYTIFAKPIIEVEYLGEETIENITQVFDEELNRTVNKTEFITVNLTNEKIIGTETLGLNVYDAPTSNIKKGLDLSGGTRVLLKPETNVPNDELNLLIDHIKQRLNAFGLSDIVVRGARDLSGVSYIVVEIAGSDEEQVRQLLSKQGDFEARVGETVVFSGGKDDITFICRSPECSRLTGCSLYGAAQWQCGFEFSITLSPDAAKRQADATKTLGVLTNGSQPYLTENLDLVLDGTVTDSLQIAADLKGRAVNQISISGSGTGSTEAQAAQVALEEMKSMQTVLSTGSLPTKLTIEKVDAVSPTLGSEFTKNAVNAAILGMLGVLIVIYLRYRRFAIVAPMAVIMVSEVVIILGLASLIGWNLDLAAIAGIIIAVGTGIDDQIVIADETLSKRALKSKESWRGRLKKAFFIIVAAYFTTIVAMFPLFFAGAGLLKAFAITTIMGVTVGVLITRPAYAKIVEVMTRS